MKKTLLSLATLALATTLNAGTLIGVGGIAPSDSKADDKNEYQAVKWLFGLDYTYAMPKIINKNSGAAIDVFDKEKLVGIRTGLILDDNHRFTVGYGMGEDKEYIEVKSFNASYDYLIGSSDLVRPFVGIGGTYLDYTVNNNSSDDGFYASSVNANAGVRVTLGERTQLEAGYRYGFQASGDDHVLIDGQMQEIEADGFSAIYVSFGASF